MLIIGMSAIVITCAGQPWLSIAVVPPGSTDSFRLQHLSQVLNDKFAEKKITNEVVPGKPRNFEWSPDLVEGTFVRAAMRKKWNVDNVAGTLFPSIEMRVIASL